MARASANLVSPEVLKAVQAYQKTGRTAQMNQEAQKGNVVDAEERFRNRVGGVVERGLNVKPNEDLESYQDLVVKDGDQECLQKFFGVQWREAALGVWQVEFSDNPDITWRSVVNSMLHKATFDKGHERELDVYPNPETEAEDRTYRFIEVCTREEELLTSVYGEAWRKNAYDIWLEKGQPKLTWRRIVKYMIDLTVIPDY